MKATPENVCFSWMRHLNSFSWLPVRVQLVYPLFHSWYPLRLWVVPHFSSGIVERAKRECAWKSSHARKGDTRRGERKMRKNHFSHFSPFSPRRVSPFLAWGDFHVRSRFACSTIREEKWGTTCSLISPMRCKMYDYYCSFFLVYRTILRPEHIFHSER